MEERRSNKNPIEAQSVLSCLGDLRRLVAPQAARAEGAAHVYHKLDLAKWIPYNGKPMESALDSLQLSLWQCTENDTFVVSIFAGSHEVVQAGEIARHLEMLGAWLRNPRGRFTPLSCNEVKPLRASFGLKG